MLNTIFFRNDDVRDKLDKSLIDLTMIFIENKIPITHAVEPANVTREVVEWLNEIKNKYPEYIEIMQHGYDHTIKNKILKGEFGGQRTYEEQLTEIKHGNELMNIYFGKNWFPAFNYPYGPYNLESMRALNDCRYKVVNSHFNSEWKRKIFYFAGHTLNKGRLFDHHISWNLDYYPGTGLFEIDMNISFINKYLNEVDATFFSIDELIAKTLQYKKNKSTGVLIHHRYHNSESKIKLVEDYLNWCLVKGYNFMSISEIYNRYK